MVTYDLSSVICQLKGLDPSKFSPEKRHELEVLIDTADQATKMDWSTSGKSHDLDDIVAAANKFLQQR
jgi:hypothetical protein